jgi:hypothetical protein
MDANHGWISERAVTQAVTQYLGHSANQVEDGIVLHKQGAFSH